MNSMSHDKARFDTKMRSVTQYQRPTHIKLPRISPPVLHAKGCGVLIWVGALSPSTNARPAPSPLPAHTSLVQQTPTFR
jgi:hypothetical protein